MLNAQLLPRPHMHHPAYWLSMQHRHFPHQPHLSRSISSWCSHSTCSRRTAASASAMRDVCSRSMSCTGRCDHASAFNEADAGTHAVFKRAWVRWDSSSRICHYQSPALPHLSPASHGLLSPHQLALPLLRLHQHLRYADRPQKGRGTAGQVFSGMSITRMTMA